MDSPRHITIRILQVEEVTEDYVDWYSNPSVVKFSDNQYKKFSFDGQKEYVKNCIMNENIDLFGIFDGSRHIGNITLEGLLCKHKRAEISYVIGEQNYWGKGVASVAINQIIEVSKSHYDLHKLVAGCAEENIGSIKALKANGFKSEGIRREHLFYNNSWHNQIDFGLLLK